MPAVIKSFQYGKHTVTLETGVVARQATGSVIVNMEGTVLLVTVVGVKEPVEGRDFFPLTVNYQERMYAAGKIPGGFFKREGRPSEDETLIARLIDRPIRPLFPEGFMNEVQIIATLMSLNPEVDPDIPAIIGASAALAVSGIPFNGPVGAARVGFINNEFVLNPSSSEMVNSDLDLVVAGTQSSVLMVESEAKQLPESTMLDAVNFGHQQMQIAIQAINALKNEGSKAPWNWQPAPVDHILKEKLSSVFEQEIKLAYQNRDKETRQQALKEIRKKAKEQFCAEGSEVVYSFSTVSGFISEMESSIVRGAILAGECRIDGRDTETVRPIQADIGVLPRTHGSACFTRGETQAVVVATLGTGRDSQLIERANGERKDSFMLHYNFPPFCVGEVGMVGSPKRREIGHGRLAKRALQAVIPSENVFPYVLRVVSEITESNGSSSMASVCGTSLALMDAGVPLEAPVAGIAMGLIKADDAFAVLTDILGDEDHLGDMDFKVAGTEKGVTALQMDIKIDGITSEIMGVALEQAKRGRTHILNIMNKTINSPRNDLSQFAPRVYTFNINPDKIRDVIGKGGSTIKSITEQFGATVDITDEGKVSIVTSDVEKGEKVIEYIQKLTEEVEVNKIYEGKVVRLMDFGAFVNILPGKDGLLHISQIQDERIEDIKAVLNVGEMLRVKVLEIDRQGRIKLSKKAIENETPKDVQPEPVSNSNETSDS